MIQKLILALAMVVTIGGQSIALADDNQPKIQMAISLDGSGSMQGLIDQARRKIWKIVNELAKATKGGVVPKLEIAVYEYGKDHLPAESGHLQQLVPLVTDLDSVSDQLYNIVAGGSKEFSGWAIQSAVTELQWSDNPNDYKVIFIAGNETMKQGPVDVVDAIKKAGEKGIIVNTIHAKGFMQPNDAEKDFWIEAATFTNGSFMEIELNHVTVDVITPFDDEIISLNDDLNKTYIPFGPRGLHEWEKLIRNDENALRDGSLIDRGWSKSGVYYDRYTFNWDLVAAGQNHKEGIATFLLTVKHEYLPKDMQEMTLEEKVQHIEDKAFERKRIQEAISSLSKIRQKIVDREVERIQGPATASLEKAMIEMLHKQLEAKGFQINEE